MVNFRKKHDDSWAYDIQSMSSAVYQLVSSFNSSEGISEVPYQATHDILFNVFGLAVARDFQRSVEAVDGKFSFLEGKFDEFTEKYFRGFRENKFSS